MGGAQAPSPKAERRYILAIYKIMAICDDSRRSKCLVTLHQKERAERFVLDLVRKDIKLDYYRQIKLIEIPAANENKPNTKKVTLYKA